MYDVNLKCNGRVWTQGLRDSRVRIESLSLVCRLSVGRESLPFSPLQLSCIDGLFHINTCSNLVYRGH